MTIECFAPITDMRTIARGLMWHDVMTRAEVSHRTCVGYKRLCRMGPLDTGLTVGELLKDAEHHFQFVLDIVSLDEDPVHECDYSSTASSSPVSQGQ